MDRSPDRNIVAGNCSGDAGGSLVHSQELTSTRGASVVYITAVNSIPAVWACGVESSSCRAWYDTINDTYGRHYARCTTAGIASKPAVHDSPSCLKASCHGG